MKSFTAGPFLHVGEDTFSFDSAREAISVLKWLNAHPEVQEAFHCGWEIRLPASRLPEEIDFPGQMYGPCNAMAVGTAKGWECMAGHEHVSGAAYFEEEEVHAMAQAGHLPPANARYMDGREVY